MGGYSLTIKIAIKQVFPFLFGTLWYITCYVLYYCVHGFVNRGLRGVKVNTKLPLIGILFFDIIIWMIGGLYFTELVGFIMIHVFTWYLKELLHGRKETELIKIGRKLLILGLVGWSFGAIVFNLIGLKIGLVGNKFHYWNRFYNPFIMAIAYGLMLIASQIKLQSFVVNKLSSYSLFIYMFTGNQLLRIYPDNSLYDVIVEKYGSSMFVCTVFVVAYSLVKLVLGIGVSIVYKNTIGKLTKIVVEKECNWIEKMVARIK